MLQDRVADLIIFTMLSFCRRWGRRNRYCNSRRSSGPKCRNHPERRCRKGISGIGNALPCTIWQKVDSQLWNKEKRTRRKQRKRCNVNQNLKEKQRLQWKAQTKPQWKEQDMQDERKPRIEVKSKSIQNMLHQKRLDKNSKTQARSNNVKEAARGKG